MAQRGNRPGASQLSTSARIALTCACGIGPLAAFSAASDARSDFQIGLAAVTARRQRARRHIAEAHAAALLFRAHGRRPGIAPAPATATKIAFDASVQLNVRTLPIIVLFSIDERALPPFRVAASTPENATRGLVCGASRIEFVISDLGTVGDAVRRRGCNDRFPR